MRDRLIDERAFDELSQISTRRRLVLATSLARRAARHGGIVTATLLWAGGSILLALLLCLTLNLGAEWGWYAGWPRPMVVLIVLGSPLLVPVVTYPPLSYYTTPRLRTLMREMLVTREGKPMLCFACGYVLHGRRYAPRDFADLNDINRARSQVTQAPISPGCPECGEPVRMQAPRRRTLPRWRGLSRRLTDWGRLRFG